MTKPLGLCASDEAPVAILQPPPPLAEQEAPIRENYDLDSLLTEHHKEQLELSGKRLEILKEVVPNLTRVAVLANPTHVMTAPTVSELRSAARALGLRIQMHEVAEAGKIEAAFAAMTKQRAGELMMLQEADVLRSFKTGLVPGGEGPATCRLRREWVGAGGWAHELRSKLA
jgi:hypothetical protein